MRTITEFYWGLIFLASSIWLGLVSIWKYMVYIQFMQMVLLDWFEVMVLILNLGFVFVFLGASVYSFQLSRIDTTFEKTNELWIKVALLIFLGYSAYAVYGSIDLLINWA